MKRSGILGTAAASLLGANACQTVPVAVSGAIFRNPASYRGQEVRLCGYLIGSANILARPNDVNVGLTVDAPRPLSTRLARMGERARVCLAGTITYFGCETGPEICTGAAFDYAIAVREIL